MPSWRTKPLPKHWQRIRRRVLMRDNYLCHVCAMLGADAVDHIVPASQGGSDAWANLAAIHESPCHARKTAGEANAANPLAVPRKRPQEKHPGDLT